MMTTTIETPPQLVPVLEKLALSGVLANLETRAREARVDGLSYAEFLYRVLADEVHHRMLQPGAFIETPRTRRPRAPLSIGEASRWFQVSGQEPVDLARRGPIRRILTALVAHHTQGNAQAMDVAEVVEAGWPGETVSAAAGATRVYTAIRTLRRMGLEGILLTRDEGYLIDPKLEIVRIDD